jgi:SNF2 family DNA or RNA helicase
MSKVVVSLSKKHDHAKFLIPADRQDLFSSLLQSVANLNLEFTIESREIVLSFPDGLYFIKDIAGLRTSQKFELISADAVTSTLLRDYKRQLTQARNARDGTSNFSNLDIEKMLLEKGFDKRKLTNEQLRDLRHLISLDNGANFSVPGAGKTTVTLALNIVLNDRFDRMLVVCPKSAFQEWEKIIDLCMSNPDKTDKFIRLSADSPTMRLLTDSDHKRFIINYEMARANESEIRRFLMMSNTHLVMDESHRIKGGMRNQTGSFALRVAPLATRRDILSGTPMVQGNNDIAAQAEFLWPGLGLGYRIRNMGEAPTTTLRGLFVRTTKAELGLPEVTRNPPRDISMNKYQLALYSTLADQVLAQFLATPNSRVMRRTGYVTLLQASVYPSLIKTQLGMSSEMVELLRLAREEGLSPKMKAVIEMCRENALQGKKTVVWTIFTETLLELKRQMMDLNAEVIFGGNPADSNLQSLSREDSLNRFLKSKNCFVLIANPAAAAEGISLHTACHDAIYLDRSYNAGHFLQSIDRIHRLGLSKNTVTNVTVLRSVTPDGIRCIDSSVSRRLSAKVRNLEALLNDSDLREIAMAEDDTPISEDLEMTRDDVIDLISELQGKTIISAEE